MPIGAIIHNSIITLGHISHSDKNKLTMSIQPGAVLALARWGANGGTTIPAGGPGGRGTICSWIKDITVFCSWIKDITGLFKWKSREARPKWGATGRSHIFHWGVGPPPPPLWPPVEPPLNTALTVLVGWQNWHPACKSSATTVPKSLLLGIGLTRSNLTWNNTGKWASRTNT